MAVTIIANGFMGTLKQQRVSTNTTNTKLSDILNNANIIPPVTNEPNKVFSYWATTISGFDIGDYTISQLYSIGAITKDNILNIYANFTYVANSIQVTFNANGGTFTDGSTSKVITTTMGSIYGELESSISVLPTKSGSYFLKWTDPKNNTVNGSYEFTESVVITAQYSASANTSVTVKDSRSKPVISGSFPKLTLWRDLYAQAISNGYKPDDVKKVFSSIKPGYGSYTGQAIKSIDFSVANNQMKIGWLRGSIYEAANADPSLYTNRNLLLGTKDFSGGEERWFYYNSSDSVPAAETYNGHTVLQTNAAWGGPKYLINDLFRRKVVSANTDYTLSVKIKNTSNQVIPIAIFRGSDVIDVIDLPANSDWTTIQATLQFPNIDYEAGLQSIRFEPNRSIPAGEGLILQTEMKLEKGTTATPYQQAPEDTNKKIRDFSATKIPVDPSTTFAVTGKVTNLISLTHNPIGLDEYWTNRNLFVNSQILPWGLGINGSLTLDKVSFDSTTNMWHIVAPQHGDGFVGIYVYNYDNKIPTNSHWAYSADVRGTGKLSMFGIENGQKNPIVGNVTSNWSRISQTGYIDNDKKTIVMYFDNTDSPLDVYIKLPKLEVGTLPTPWTPAMEDIKPGLWLNDNWLYNPYTQKWLDTPIDNTDYSYANSVITFKDYFNVQYVTGDISKVRSSVTATVKSVVAGYGSTTDRKALYDNSYFPNDDSGVTLNVEEYLGFSYIVFYNPSTGYSQTVYQQAGTAYSEFLKGITRSKFEAAGKYLKGFYVSNYWTNAKMIASNPINSPIDLAVSDYLLQLASSFTTVFFNANGGVFYRGTSYETQQISVDVSKTDTYSIVSGYIPEVKKRTLGLLYWALDLEHMEPAYPNIVVDQSTVFAKWSVIDNIELYRKPREYYLVDASTIIKGWDQMDRFSISDKNNIFVIDPEGNGAVYDTASTYTSNGWGSAEQELKGGTLSFDAYYNGYSQYNRLGRWMRGKELAMVRLDETGIPTYWMVKPAEIERTEIKYNEQYLKGKLSFTKLSPPFDLEFIGIGTDNIIDNGDNMFRRNAYIYIHSLKVPGPDNGVQIIAQNDSTTIEDSVAVDLPAGSYFEYSTIPFKERWKYGPTWSDMPNNLYNNIVNLATARPIILGIGTWELSVSSSNITTINSLSPHKIQDYAGKTIDSLGGLGPFMGIAIKEKEL